MDPIVISERREAEVILDALNHSVLECKLRSKRLSKTDEGIGHCYQCAKQKEIAKKFEDVLYNGEAD